MNIADPICNYQNLAAHLTPANVHFIRSVFGTGLRKIIFHLDKYNTNIQGSVLHEAGEIESPISGDVPGADPIETFLSNCLGKTRQMSMKIKNQAVTVHDLAYLEQLKKNPCYRDNAIVSPPEILLKQGEFILMGIQVFQMSHFHSFSLNRTPADNYRLLQLLLQI